MNHNTAIVLDLRVLTAMYGDDSAQTITLALSGFRREATTYIEQLQLAIQCNTLPDIARFSHSLKSMCGLVGAGQLMQLCQNLEQAARQQDGPSLARLAPELRQIWHSLLTALNTTLQQYGYNDA